MYLCTCGGLYTAREYYAMQVVLCASLIRYKLEQIKTRKLKGFLIDTNDDLLADLM